MVKITCYPIGNADCTLIDLRDGQKLLFDYADTRNLAGSFDRHIDLPRALRTDLKEAKREAYDVVAFTHLDKDHTLGSSEFFYFEHAAKYQGGERIKIGTLWVPAAAILDEDSEGDARVIRQEAKYRLRKGEGIRVFSRPEKLREWLANNDIRLEDRKHLITDAGQLIPGFDQNNNGVEFFVHSPFATRLNNTEVVDRNLDALTLQATFLEGGRQTKALFLSDIDHSVIEAIVDVTRYHGREVRLEWHVVHLPHHCSYLSLSPQKGTEKTQPVPKVAWLYEEQGQPGGIVVSPSKPIPTNDEDLQPPHRQAAAYYKECVQTLGGDFKVTMEHPTRSTAQPKPLVIRIDALGATIEKPSEGGATAAMSQPAPRAG